MQFLGCPFSANSVVPPVNTNRQSLRNRARIDREILIQYQPGEYRLVP
jgi:hypothetical protein